MSDQFKDALKRGIDHKLMAISDEQDKSDQAKIVFNCIASHLAESAPPALNVRRAYDTINVGQTHNGSIFFFLQLTDHRISLHSWKKERRWKVSEIDAGETEKICDLLERIGRAMMRHSPNSQADFS